jgi:hypothetical protein
MDGRIFCDLAKVFDSVNQKILLDNYTSMAFQEYLQYHTIITPYFTLCFPLHFSDTSNRHCLLLHLPVQILQFAFMIHGPYIPYSNLVAVIFLLPVCSPCCKSYCVVFPLETPPDGAKENTGIKKNGSTSNMSYIGYGKHYYQHYPQAEY